MVWLATFINDVTQCQTSHIWHISGIASRSSSDCSGFMVNLTMTTVNLYKWKWTKTQSDVNISWNAWKYSGRLWLKRRAFNDSTINSFVINFSSSLLSSLDRSASFSARPKGDIQFQRPTHASSSTSQLQSHPDSSQSDFHHQGSSSTITSSIGGSSGLLTGSPQGEGGGDQAPSDGKRGKQKTAQPNARSESYKECSPKRSRTNRPKSDPSLYE